MGDDRDNNGRFKSGNLANPGGRPRAVVEVVEFARKHTLTAMNALVRIVKDESKDERARVKAAEVLLDRAWGKAPAHVTVSGRFDVVNWTAEEKAQRLAVLRSKLLLAEDNAKN